MADLKALILDVKNLLDRMTIAANSRERAEINRRFLVQELNDAITKLDLEKCDKLTVDLINTTQRGILPPLKITAGMIRNHTVTCINLMSGLPHDEYYAQVREMLQLYNKVADSLYGTIIPLVENELIILTNFREKLSLRDYKKFTEQYEAEHRRYEILLEATNAEIKKTYKLRKRLHSLMRWGTRFKEEHKYTIIVFEITLAMLGLTAGILAARKAYRLLNIMDRSLPGIQWTYDTVNWLSDLATKMI